MNNSALPEHQAKDIINNQEVYAIITELENKNSVRLGTSSKNLKHIVFAGSSIFQIDSDDSIFLAYRGEGFRYFNRESRQYENEEGFQMRLYETSSDCLKGIEEINEEIQLSINKSIDIIQSNLLFKNVLA